MAKSKNRPDGKHNSSGPTAPLIPKLNYLEVPAEKDGPLVANPYRLDINDFIIFDSWEWLDQRLPKERYNDPKKIVDALRDIGMQAFIPDGTPEERECLRKNIPGARGVDGLFETRVYPNIFIIAPYLTRLEIDKLRGYVIRRRFELIDGMRREGQRDVQETKLNSIAYLEEYAKMLDLVTSKRMSKAPEPLFEDGGMIKCSGTAGKQSYIFIEAWKVAFGQNSIKEALQFFGKHEVIFVGWEVRQKNYTNAQRSPTIQTEMDDLKDAIHWLAERMKRL
jgi:hypothetical protein